MLSVEHGSFRPSDLSRSGTGPGGASLDQLHSSTQQSVVPTTHEIIQRCPPVEPLLPPLDNSLFTSSAEDNSPQAPVLNGTPVIGAGSLSLQELWAEAKQARRKLWEETGYVPPAAGGSPRPKIDLPLDHIRRLYFEGWTQKDIARELNVRPATISNRLIELEQQIPTYQEAKAFVEGFYHRDFDRRNEHIVYFRSIHEVNRLDDLYPGLAQEVYQALKQKLLNHDSQD